ncbi:MAG: DoxX family protein [Rhizobiaceae bacterium]|nr:DoxX family protein [Rhizobiaceae bacterium]
MRALISLYDTLVGGVERITQGWFFGLFARFIFASVLYFYFLNSAKTKVGDGILGFFAISDNAYYQIVLPAVEAASGDVSQVAFFPWGLMVFAGTYGEFILPVLIVLGLFTRIAAVGMIAFVAVQSWVDIYVHQLDAKTIGAMFDRFSDSLIADQRLLWLFPLVYLAVRGAGAVSLDRLLLRWRNRKADDGTQPSGFAIN